MRLFVASNSWGFDFIVSRTSLLQPGTNFVALREHRWHRLQRLLTTVNKLYTLLCR